MGKIAYYCGSDKVAAAVEQLFESFPVGRVDKKVSISSLEEMYFISYFYQDLCQGRQEQTGLAEGCL